jgi:hypothetical protein
MMDIRLMHRRWKRGGQLICGNCSDAAMIAHDREEEEKMKNTPLTDFLENPRKHIGGII